MPFIVYGIIFINFLYAWKFCKLFCRLDFCFLLTLKLSGISSEYQTVWYKIRPGILSGLSWVQTVCQRYQQRIKVATGGERVKHVNKKFRKPITCSRTCHWYSAQEKVLTLRKHAYSNILKILPLKIEHFQIKNYDIFHISAQNIDSDTFLISAQNIGYGTRYNRLDKAVLTNTHNLCFWAEIRKNNVYSCKPQFYYIKVGFKGVKII